MILGALEAGGTKMVCSIGDENGKLFERESFPTTTPEETLRNMQQVQRAASAPADPSDQDQRVAAKAAAMAARAQQEIAAKGGAGQEETAKVAQGTPVAQNQQEKEDPSKNGVASVLASIREAQIQAQQLMPAA